MTWPVWKRKSLGLWCPFCHLKPRGKFCKEPTTQLLVWHLESSPGNVSHQCSFSSQIDLCKKAFFMQPPFPYFYILSRMHVETFRELTEWLKTFKQERASSIIITLVQWRFLSEATRCQVQLPGDFTFVNAITMAMDTVLFANSFSHSHFLTLYIYTDT